jgi:hypothetical protein
MFIARSLHNIFRAETLHSRQIETFVQFSLLILTILLLLVLVLLEEKLSSVEVDVGLVQGLELNASELL